MWNICLNFHFPHLFLNQLINHIPPHYLLVALQSHRVHFLILYLQLLTKPYKELPVHKEGSLLGEKERTVGEIRENLVITAVFAELIDHV